MFYTPEMYMNSSSDFNCVNGTDIAEVAFYVVIPISFLLGTPVNLWLIWISLNAGWKIKSTQVFVLNMTILELIYSIENAVEMLNLMMLHSETLRTAIYFVFCLTWVGIPLIQTCICLEQYLAVIHPLIFLKYKGLQYRIMCAAVIWMVSASLAFHDMLNDYNLLSVVTTTFIMSVIVISFCCVSVLCALKHPGPGDTQILEERGRGVGNQQKRNAFNTIFSGLLLILFTYLSLFTGILFSDICYINHIMVSCNASGLMIMALKRMYQSGQIKCLI